MRRLAERPANVWFVVKNVCCGDGGWLLELGARRSASRLQCFLARDLLFERSVQTTQKSTD